MSDFDLDLDKFVLGYEDFKETIIRSYMLFFMEKTLPEMIPSRILDYHTFNSSFRKDNISLFQFLNGYFFEEKETFLAFLQKSIDEFYYKDYDKINFIIKCIEKSVFDLDFYFDKKDLKIKRKLDPVSTKQINDIEKELKDGNNDLYEKCVSEFLCFNKDLLKQSHNDYYHESLDKLKEVIENVLNLNHNNTKLSEKAKIIKILFDKQNEDFSHILTYIIKKIHHNDIGRRIEINEKEYNYLWLELNKILYLLIKYRN